MTQITTFANELLQAEKERKGITPLTETDSSLTVKRAYEVQLEIINQKLQQGQKIVGKKIGLTSIAMQELLGVDEPDYGHLLNEMAVENEGDINYERVMQPKVEAEVAFILKKDLVGPNVTEKDVLEATEYVVASLEVVDSRIQDWKLTLADTVADNASSGLYVLGNKQVAIEQVDLPKIEMTFLKNGEVVNTGAGEAAMGDPATCVAWLANKLSEFNISLKAGEVILSGALSAAIEAEPGDHFEAKFTHLGDVSCKFF